MEERNEKVLKDILSNPERVYEGFGFGDIDIVRRVLDALPWNKRKLAKRKLALIQNESK